MTSREALEILVYGLQNNTYQKEDLGITMSKCREIINEDLEVLEKYRELFELIKKQKLTLEYTGHELIHYYKEIEGTDKNGK